MSGSVFQNKSGVDDWVTCLWSFLHDLMEGLADCSYILWWDIGSNNFAYELAGSFFSSWINGLDVSHNSGVLTCSSRLFFMEVVETLTLKDSFSVVDAGLAGCALNSEFTTDTFNVDLKMQLSHTADNHLLTLLIYVHAEGGVLSLELGEGFLEFGSSIRFGRFDRETHNGVGHEHTLASDWVTVIGLGERVSCGAVDSEYGEDISGFDFLNFLHVIGVHLDQSRYFNFLTEFVVPNKLSSFEFSLIHSHIS